MADTDPAPAPAPKGIFLKADTIAEPFLTEVKASLANLTRSRVPKLVGILATANAPSRRYAEFTRKQCDGLGIVFELREVGAALPDGAGSADGDGVEEAIIEANADDAVDGIMVRSYFLKSADLCAQISCITIGLLSDFWKGTSEPAPPVCQPELINLLLRFEDHYLQQIVSPFKDVEGLNYKFHFNLYHKCVSSPLN